MKRIRGLDSLRFICAVCVLFGHFGFPLQKIIFTPNSSPIFLKIGIVISLLFNGPAAVIVFFIISGFCINFPYREAQKIELLPYFSRRLLRIGIPAIIAASICYKFNSLGVYPTYGVFWSIFCEVIYYLLFPVLFFIRKYIKWHYLFAIAYAVSLAFLFLNLDDVKAKYNDYIALGPFTWVLGLPCWLLGCWLSENYQKFNTLSKNRMWVLRVGICVIVFILHVIKFHAPTVFASNCFTLNLFAIIACVWIGYEIMFFQKYEPSAIFEWGGKWSYSLYIMHPAVIGIFIYYGLGNLNTKQDYIIICSILLAYTFYLIVEKPSHKFSVYFSKFIKNK